MRARKLWATLLPILLLPLTACGDDSGEASGLPANAPVFAATPAMVRPGTTTEIVVTQNAPIPGTEFDLDADVTARSTLGDQVSVRMKDGSTGERVLIEVAAPNDVDTAADVHLILKLRARTTSGAVPGSGLPDIPGIDPSVVPVGLDPNNLRGSALVVVTPIDLPDRAVIAEKLGALARSLSAHLDGATQMASTVPLVPMRAALMRDGHDLMDPAMDLALPNGQRIPVALSVRWKFQGMKALREPSSGAVQTFRTIPAVTPVNARAPRAEVVAEATLTAPSAGGQVRETRELRLPAFDAKLPLPKVLALYRAPDMGVRYPEWRLPHDGAGDRASGNMKHTDNSGVVVFGTPVDLSAPDFGVLGHIVVPAAYEKLGDLGSRLYTLTGPINTPLGPAGLSQLPEAGAVDALPTDVRGAVRSLRALAEAIVLLTETYTALATPDKDYGRNEHFAKMVRSDSASWPDLGAVNFIGASGEPFPGAHVQDEAEAAIFLGPNGGARLWVCPRFESACRGAGKGVIEPGQSGYAAIIPDLAGPVDAGDTFHGWNRIAGASFDAAHPAPNSAYYGLVRIEEPIRNDRVVSLAPDARTSRSENLRREHSLARTVSSLKLF